MTADLRRRPKLMIRIDWTTMPITVEQAQIIDERIGHVHAATLHNPDRLRAMLRSAYLQGALDSREAERTVAASPPEPQAEGRA